MEGRNIAIRAAGLGDYLTLLDMQTRSMRQLGRAFYSAREIDALINRIGTLDAVLEDGRSWVALVDGVIAASGGWSLRRPGYARCEVGDAAAPDPPRPSIRAVFCDPAHARRGLGRRLMARLEQDILTAGYAAVDLVGTLNAVSFCAALGFRGARPVVLDLGGGVRLAAVAMSKRLAAPARLVA